MHPERHELVGKMAEKAGRRGHELVGNAVRDQVLILDEFHLRHRRKHTLEDIFAELEAFARSAQRNSLREIR